ncbi:putative E3 ubiquitin-protein ligase [Basidiobolus ranarum]|uniref:E3 ubiquitin-protein ligase n=1 Tax=Basidiobolus ranarum TaxID=34480 RepID=A0ABR2WQ42_9FUNG
MRYYSSVTHSLSFYPHTCFLMALTNETTIIIPVIFHSSTIRPTDLNNTHAVHPANNSQVLRQLLNRHSNLLLIPHNYERESQQRRVNQTRPASKQVMAELPKISTTSHYLTTQPSCSICQDDFLCDKNQIRSMPCHHIFHEHCLFPWLSKSNTCPMCRLEIEREREREPEPKARMRQCVNQPKECGQCHGSIDRDYNGELNSLGTIKLIGCKHIFHTCCLSKLAITEQESPTQHSYVRCPTCQMEHLIKSSLLVPCTD